MPCRLAARAVAARAALCLVVGPLAAQQAPDSARTTLPEVSVTVTRTPEPLARVPQAVAVLDQDQLRRGQATLGLDEALNNLPGVFVANRYNYSLDQRLSIRGFGSRAAFGTRGLKILIDGIPQTTPDGQSQFTNLELANIGRVEVLRGSASSLYGNAAGGVLSFTSEEAAPARFGQSVLVEGGAYGLLKGQVRSSLRAGALASWLSLSRVAVDGFRQQSRGEVWNANLGADLALGARSRVELRLNWAENPVAQNPGALTFAEYARNADSAAAANILRASNARRDQQQLGLSFRWRDERGQAIDATLFGYLRAVDNMTATPATVQPGAGVGTFVRFRRQVAGVRLAWTRPLGAPTLPRLVAGLDAQLQLDDRTNFRSVSGVATGTRLLEQAEQVRQAGPFAQLVWEPDARWLVQAGARYDVLAFRAIDRFLTDGEDNSGRRTLGNWSGNLGVSRVLGPGLSVYANASTSFETPTTTELAISPDQGGGFSRTLGPQQALNLEAGVRGRALGWLSWTASAFTVRIRDAIVQYAEVNGRNYFTNAGRVRSDGAEVGVTVAPVPAASLFVNWTWSRYRFEDYVVVRGATSENFAGKTLPGIPEHFIRVGLRTQPLAGLALDVDHTVSTSVFTDDRNTLAQKVDAWSATSARLSWRGPLLGGTAEPFVGVNNLLDRRYVGSVTINGAGGRVLEPSPGRTLYAGLQLRSWPLR